MSQRSLGLRSAYLIGSICLICAIFPLASGFPSVVEAYASDRSYVGPLKAAPQSDLAPIEDYSESGTNEKPIEPHPAMATLENFPIYDESNPDFIRLQRIDEATRHLKKDVVGFPDWMDALNSGAINPLAGLSRDARMSILDLDVVMRNTKEMPFVRFPHRSHTMWLDCSNCHPTPFIPKVGANSVSMSDIFRGRYCGMCHDRIAFITFFSCQRCHSVAQSKIGIGK
jgi:c(7)-type cytochrome triheme protein